MTRIASPLGALRPVELVSAGAMTRHAAAHYEAIGDEPALARFMAALADACDLEERRRIERADPVDYIELDDADEDPAAVWRTGELALRGLISLRDSATGELAQVWNAVAASIANARDSRRIAADDLERALGPVTIVG